MSSELRDNKAEQRFEMTEQGMTSWADYRLTGDRLFIDHVESPVPLRGTGASGRLMAALAAEAYFRPPAPWDSMRALAGRWKDENFRNETMARWARELND